MNLALLLLVPACLAGAAALLLELVWIQRAGAALPGAAPAAALVLPTILLAWAAGSWVAGLRADRPEERLGRAARWLVAAAVGVWAAPTLLETLLPQGGVTSPWARALLGGLPAAPAAFALGGVMPWLTRLRAAHGLAPLPAAAGSAAAVALGGALAAGRLEAGWLADGGDPLDASAALLAAAALALVLLRALAVAPAADASADATPAPEDPADAGESALPWWLVACLAGAVLVGGQVLLLRVLAQSRADSLATTAALLGALHLGMALGAALLGRFGGALFPGTRGVLLLALGAVGLALPGWGFDTGADAPLWLGLPLGLGCGCVLVAAADVAPRGARGLGVWVGSLGAASTLGGVAGGALVGALLLGGDGAGSAAGLRWAPLALLPAGVALALARTRGRRRPARLLPLLVAGAALVVAPAWQAPWRAAPDDVELLIQREGTHGIVSLVRTADGSERLQVDGRFGLGGSGAGAALEQRMGRLAAAMHPGAQRALLLGVGRGHTLAGLAGTTRAVVDAVEHNAEVLALDLGVPALLGRGGSPPTARVRHADARAWLAREPEAYDLVVGDLFHPWVSGAGSLLSTEHFFDVRRALTDDGVCVQWLPLHQLQWSAFGAVVRAFREAFPNTHVLVASALSDTPLVALVGGKTPALPAADAVNELLGATPCLAGPNHMSGVFDSVLCASWPLERELADGPRNTLEHPWSEWWSQGRDDDEERIAAHNLRRLALLAEPLAWNSFEDPPFEIVDRKTLGLELQARSAALAALLHARADLAEVRAAAARGAPLQARLERERQLALRLLDAWRVFPGHLDVRRMMLERAAALAAQGRPEDGAALLGEALRVHADGPLGAALGGSLLALDRDVDALHVLRQARALAPEDPSLLLNLARAEFTAGARDAAQLRLLDATRVLAPQPLPAAAQAALALLERRRGARLAAEEVLEALPAQHGWARVLRELLDDGETTPPR